MNNRQTMLAIDALFEGGRMFVGGISVAFMLTRGISPTSVVLIKALQAAVVFWGELPTGIVGDRFGRKVSLLTSVVCAFFGFLSYFFGHSLNAFLAGEFLMALALCFWSGSYEALAMDVCQIAGDKQAVTEFFHMNATINQLAVVVGGMCGGLIVGPHNHYSHAFLGSLLAMVFLGLLLIRTPRENHLPDLNKSFSQGTQHLFKVSLQAVWHNPQIRNTVGTMIFLQFLAQPVLHYWQPLSQNTLGLSGRELSFMFSLFCLGSAGLIFFLKRFKNLKQAFLLPLWAFMILLLGLGTAKVQIWGALMLVQMSYSYLRSTTNSNIAFHAPCEHRASILSAANFLARLGMLGSLGLIGLLFKYAISPNLPTTYSQLFLIYGIIGVMGALLFSILRLKIKTAESLPQNVEPPKK